jgi:hypothetical protein
MELYALFCNSFVLLAVCDAAIDSHINNGKVIKKTPSGFTRTTKVRFSDNTEKDVVKALGQLVVKCYKQFTLVNGPLMCSEQGQWNIPECLKGVLLFFIPFYCIQILFVQCRTSTAYLMNAQINHVISSISY